MNAEGAQQPIGQTIMAARAFHDQAWQKLDRLEEASRKIADGKSVDRTEAFRRIEEVASFLGNDLEPHFRLEEEKVFPLMKTLLPPSGRASLEARVKEHAQIRSFGRELVRLLRSAEQSGAGATQEQVIRIRDLSVQAIRVTRDHIGREDAINRVIYSLTPRTTPEQ